MIDSLVMSGEKALLPLFREAYIKGTGTWQVYDLLQAIGLKSVGKSKGSCTVKNLDELSQYFRQAGGFSIELLFYPNVPLP